jgi:serine/threonine protein kinase/tetratricopeptide (TPR) repeat protein
MGEQSNRAKAIFLAALEDHAPEQWPAFLEQACAGDVLLRAEVEKLLRARSEMGSFHELPRSTLLAREDVSITESPGTVIGPYKLLEQIGEGGFGVVFMAEQQQPVRRKVALKVLKPGMDTKQVVARFEAERQALALMDHPHIAQVHDAGTTATGRPYFVMELIRGIPITQFCDDNRLTPRERLELFLAVCQAVQHAHQKGIIHRDLKPSNVLVTLLDGTPTAKVIDFGIAKALGHERLTDKTLFTGFAQLIGTPLYMSPEQAEMGGRDVDTRTDIYALGVLLYELLTSTTPFEKQRLQEASYDELRRIIREEEPAKPSTRISTLGQAAITVSANRKSEPKRLSQLFRGELDWIVMKALEKDRNRRYDTASALAADVQHYLDDEPVQACPPTLGRRVAKWGRRHKTVVWAGVLLLVVASIASGVSTFLIMQQRDVAQANQHRAEQILETAYRSMDTVYLTWAEKHLVHMKELTAEDRQFLENALTFYVDFANQDSSQLQGRLQTANAYLRVAKIQAELGNHAQAKGNYRHALDALQKLAAEFPDHADCRRKLARCLTEMADCEVAHPLYFDTKEENEAAFRQAIKIQESLVAQDPTRVDYQGDLEKSYADLGFFLREAYRRYDEAERLTNSALTICARLAAERPTDLTYRKEFCDLLGRMGGVFMDTERLQEAEQIFRKSLERRQQLVLDFPGSPQPRFCLGFGYQDLAIFQATIGARQDAEQNFRQAVDVSRKLATDFPGVRPYRNQLYASYNALVHVCSEMGRVQEAETACQQANEFDPSGYWFWYCDAPLRLQQGDLEGYRQVCREMLTRFSQSDDPYITEATAETCLLYPAAVDDLGPVRQLARRAVTGTEQNHGYRWFLRTQGMAEYRAGRFASAIERLKKALSLEHDTRYSGDPALTATAYVFLAMAYHQQRHASAARQALDQATQLLEQIERKTAPKKTPLRHWGDWLSSNWSDGLRFRVVYREAVQLVQGGG